MLLGSRYGSSSLYRCSSSLFLAMLRLTFIIVNSLYFFSSVKCVYTFVLSSSDSSVSESSSGSMFDTFKDIGMNVFLKSMKSNICSVIAMLYSTFVMLMFFWGIGFQSSFFGCRQSLAKCFFLL